MGKTLEFIEKDINQNDVSLIGISTNLSNLSLVQRINLLFSINFKLSRDIEAWEEANNIAYFFKLYYYYLKSLKAHIFLIKNINIKDKSLFNRIHGYNYLFVILGSEHLTISKEFISKIKNKEGINHVKILGKEIESFSSIESVTYELFPDQSIINQTTRQTTKKRSFNAKTPTHIINYKLEDFHKDINYYVDSILNEKRLFIGYKPLINKEIMQLSNDIIKAFKDKIIRAMEPDNLHLTLAFLNSIANKNIRNVELSVKRAIQGIDTIEIELDRLGYFEKSNQYVIWLGIKENPILISLTNKIYQELEKENIFYCDKEEFVGHITLARVKKGNYDIDSLLENLFNISPQKLILENLNLFNSISIDNTIRYDILRMF